MIPELAPQSASTTPTTSSALERARAWTARDGLALVPVAERREDSGSDPSVVALDARGSAVLVVGVTELTAQDLVSALARTASVREVGMEELGSWYHGGESGLRDAWWRLRVSSPAVGESPALIVIATSVRPDVEAALTLLPSGLVRVLLPTTTPAVPAGFAAPATPAPAAPAPAPAATATATAKPPQKSAPVRTPTKPATAQRRQRAVGEMTQHEQLQAVAALVGEASLVLAGDEGGVSGRLVADGTIVVDGDSYTDPSHAAAAALGRPVADGWARWRFGADGPFLGEALQEALTRPQRARPHRRRAVRG